VIAWAVAIVSAEVLRFEFLVNRIHWPQTLGLIAALAVAQLCFGWLGRLYNGRYARGAFEEVRSLALATSASAAVVIIPMLVFRTYLTIPRSTVFIAYPITLLIMFAVRYVSRLLVERGVHSKQLTEPAIIFGAGYVGSSMIHRMLTDQTSPYRPVALLDDDPAKRNLRIRNVDVRGSFDDLAQVVDQTGARVLIVAVTRADAKLVGRVMDAAQSMNLKVKIVPTLDQMLEGGAANDVREISVEDIIGRHPVDLDVESIAGYLTGKRVLVTGAGGSIGVELCRQIHRFGPAELIMLDRDETGLQGAQLAVRGHGLLNNPEVVLADIRDAAAIREIFVSRHPEVVFHAAALKHLPMLQQYPEEAWKTNIIGTLNVLQAARAAGVSTFVNVSTDKAANPTSVLGHSKRMAEKLTAWMANETGMTYLSVRFGNVLGSRGSMLPLFASMIDKGGPLTVTHPKVTRYFMTIPEACQLVVQAGSIGRPGEVLILDMGEPVRILDIAQRMIEMSGRRIEIVFTGLREGEKLHEDLVAEDEVTKSIHPKIMRARIQWIAPEQLDKTKWLAQLDSSAQGCHDDELNLESLIPMGSQ
jgi:dTDP-glucose 4,6-dehydratase